MRYDFINQVGENPRTDSAVQAIYRDLRDARSRARAEERAQETPNEEGHILMSAPAVWSDVHRHALAILTNHALDIEVAVWLIEAASRTEGYEGLAALVTAINDMIVAHGMTLHPQPEEHDDDTFEALGGLNGVGREGTLVQPLRLLPLVPGHSYGSCTLWDVETAGRDGAVQAEMASAGEVAMRAHLSNVIAARGAFVKLDASLTELRGQDAPPFARLIDLLDDTARTIRRLSGAEEPLADALDDTGPSAPTPEGPSARSQTTVPNRIESREDALRTLGEVAAFFRRTEPHSPISHTLETLVRRGRMDFMTLLAELIPDDHARESVLTSAGIKQPTGRPDSAE